MEKVKEIEENNRIIKELGDKLSVLIGNADQVIQVDLDEAQLIEKQNQEYILVEVMDEIRDYMEELKEKLMTRFNKIGDLVNVIEKYKKAHSDTESNFENTVSMYNRFNKDAKKEEIFKHPKIQKATLDLRKYRDKLKEFSINLKLVKEEYFSEIEMIQFKFNFLNDKFAIYSAFLGLDTNLVNQASSDMIKTQIEDISKMKVE